MYLYKHFIRGPQLYVSMNIIFFLFLPFINYDNRVITIIIQNSSIDVDKFGVAFGQSTNRLENVYYNV